MKKTMWHVRFLRFLLAALFAFAALSAIEAAPAEVYAAPVAKAQQWIWLSSNNKYSKFFDPASVTVTRKATTSHGDVATEIEAWTKTGYSYEGAAETIANYDIGDVLPNASLLSYSLARIRVNPQNRTVLCLQETFYDADNRVIWSRAEGNVKEMNSQEFDEEFYGAVVDQVFRLGELARMKSDNRWRQLYEDKTADGVVTVAKADTSTMRMKDANLIYWEWLQRQDADAKVIEIKFVKKAVNLSKGTEKVLIGKYWSPSTRWQELEDDMEGRYRMIGEKSPEYKGLEILRAFAGGYSMWVHRYSL